MTYVKRCGKLWLFPGVVFPVPRKVPGAIKRVAEHHVRVDFEQRVVRRPLQS